MAINVSVQYNGGFLPDIIQYAPAIKKLEIALRLYFLFSWKHEHDFLKGVFLIFASSFCFFLNFLSCSLFLSHIFPVYSTTSTPN